MSAQLGEKYRDRFTGFEGTATATTRYLNGCVQVCLERADKDGKPEEAWFDEQRLEGVQSSAKVGGPGVTPPERSHGRGR